ELQEAEEDNGHDQECDAHSLQRVAEGARQEVKEAALPDFLLLLDAQILAPLAARFARLKRRSSNLTHVDPGLAKTVFAGNAFPDGGTIRVPFALSLCRTLGVSCRGHCSLQPSPQSVGPKILLHR